MPVSEQSVALPPRYRVRQHIANGGMASVWAAEDERLGRLVAVKVLSPAYAQDERANRRFLREARAGARLSDCRHVVTVYDIGEHGGRPFMVMEHIPGGTVADRLRSGRPIDRALAMRWLREAGEALDCAHRHDVVHRDVKPANLLIDERGHLHVGDFGIATVATEASVTQTGQVLGTAAYISPEQARGEPATAASDRYALGCVAFEMLTGRRPYSGAHPAAQARAHVEASVPSAAAVGDLPVAVDDVMRLALAKDPARRPATAAEFLDALENALNSEDSEPAGPLTAATSRVATARPTTGSLRPQPVAARRRWPGVAALAALAVVAGAAIAIALGTAGGSGGTTATTQAQTTHATNKPKTKPKPKAAQPATTQTQQAPQTQATQQTQQAPQTQATQQTQTAQTTAQSQSDNPVSLNNTGFSLIQQGKPNEAVAPLQRAVSAFRTQGRTGEVDYAYALFNLGNALRLSGQPAAAIPYLQERLRISNYKRGVVKKELKTAQNQA
jgi:eukaryotic-like serine/threonine-protein kinase